jgi:hypothetical protein
MERVPFAKNNHLHRLNMQTVRSRVIRHISAHVMRVADIHRLVRRHLHLYVIMQQDGVLM